MSKISIITTMTDPKSRKDPWEEALTCYNDLADEVIITGENWPKEFSWRHIGETFQEGLDKASGEWVLRMDLDYFFHERDIKNIKKMLNKYTNYPIVSFPQLQFFKPTKYSLRALLSVAINKKFFPEIKLNGGGDLCLPTLENILLDPFKNPISKYPIYQYDSFFRDKTTISKDRARFARAWFREFGNYQDRGGPDDYDAYIAWENMIQSKTVEHFYSFNIKNHPKYIKDKIINLSHEAFGYNAFDINYLNPDFKTFYMEVKKRTKIYNRRKIFELKNLWKI